MHIARIVPNTEIETRRVGHEIVSPLVAHFRRSQNGPRDTAYIL